MEKMKMTCIVCPNGCQLEVLVDEDDVADVSGNRCMRGYAYAQKEVLSTTRTVTTTLEVEGGELPRVSVKTEREIPKDRIMDCMQALKDITVKAPVQIGDIVAQNVAGTGIDVVATVNVHKK